MLRDPVLENTVVCPILEMMMKWLYSTVPVDADGGWQ
jgi:hypothetical protein